MWQNWGKLQVKPYFSNQNWTKLQVELRLCHVISSHHSTSGHQMGKWTNNTENKKLVKVSRT